MLDGERVRPVHLDGGSVLDGAQTYNRRWRSVLRRADGLGRRFAGRSMAHTSTSRRPGRCEFAGPWGDDAPWRPDDPQCP